MYKLNKRSNGQGGTSPLNDEEKKNWLRVG